MADYCVLSMITFFLEGLDPKDNVFCIFSRSRGNDEKEFKRGMLKLDAKEDGQNSIASFHSNLWL
jgi:hypothetical protein